MIWYIDMWKVCNGSCITTTVEWHLGDGSTIIIMHPAFQVSIVHSFMNANKEIVTDILFFGRFTEG